MATRPSASDYIRTLQATVPTLARQIKDLAIAEMKPSAVHGGIGAGMFGGAAVFGLNALKLLCFAGAFGVSLLYYHFGLFDTLSSLALGFLSVGVALGLIALIVALIGYGQVKKIKKPEATIAEAKASLGAIGDAVQMGTADAENRSYPAGAEQVVAKSTRLR